MPESLPGEHELAVVMPVYNEEECIQEVVSAWMAVLDKEGIRFRMLILDDGSTDGSLDELAELAADERITIIRKPNTGHGPTVLLGYRYGVETAGWVFQVDSDGEMPPESFPDLWHRRAEFNALFGYRKERRQQFARWLITRCSRLTVACLLGGRVHDVNVPYRLMRSDVLVNVLPLIPESTFAPNLVIAGALSRMDCRLCNHPVPHTHRKTGCTSIRSWRLWKASLKALAQTCACSLRIRRSVRKCKGRPRIATNTTTVGSQSRSPG